MWYHPQQPLNLWLFSNNIKSRSFLVQNFIMLHGIVNDINLNDLINLPKSFFRFTAANSGILALKSSCTHTPVRKFIFRIKIEKSRTSETQNWLPLSFIITIILKIYDFQFNAATCWAFILKRSFSFLAKFLAEMWKIYFLPMLGSEWLQTFPPAIIIYKQHSFLTFHKHS